MKASAPFRSSSSNRSGFSLWDCLIAWVREMVMGDVVSWGSVSLKQDRNQPTFQEVLLSFFVGSQTLAQHYLYSVHREFHLIVILLVSIYKR